MILFRRKRGDIRPPGPDPEASLMQWVQYLFVCLLRFKMRLTPWFVTQWLGAGLGSLIHAINAKHRRVCLLNLDKVFGDRLDERAKRAIVKACYVHFARALFETLKIDQITEANLKRRVEIHNADVFWRALEKGRGVILCTAHYGNWEVMNRVLGLMGLPMSVMARPLDNPLVHRLLEDLRMGSGNEVIYKHKSVRKLLTSLKSNRVIGIVNDQNVHDRNRLLVDFFGHPAATTPVPAALAYRTGAPIITGYSVPIGGGRYRLIYHEPIEADPQAPKKEEIVRLTGLINRKLEAQIESDPEYWFWFHKRFKTGAQGQSTYYQQPRAV